MKPVIAILATLLLAGCAKADAPKDAAPATSAPAPAASVAEQALAGSGVEIAGTLEAPAGYHGFVGSYRGQQLPVYVLPDGKHIMVGSLYDLQGHDLTSPAMRKVADSGLGAAQWAMLEQSTWVAEGNPAAKRVVYVFSDTRCPYCHHLWLASQPWLQRGDVQVRNILVAVISPDSLPEAASILDAADPTAAWQTQERDFGKHAKPAADAGSAAARAKVQANSELMTTLGFFGTPAVIYKDASGEIRALSGMPRDQQGLQEVFGG